MSAEAAAEYRAIGRFMAERYPRAIKLEVAVSPADLRELRLLAMMGKHAPSGMYLLNWQSRTVLWCNAALAEHLNVIQPGSAFDEHQVAGLTLEQVIPGFAGSQLEAIYCKVSEKLEPFTARQYAWHVPSRGMSYWDWSITPLPCSRSGATLLLVQVNAARTPRKLAAAA